MTTSWPSATLCSTWWPCPKTLCDVSSWILCLGRGVACSLTFTCSVTKLSFQGFKTINHLFCGLSSLLSLSCSDTHLNQLLLLIFATFNVVSTLFIILLSYVSIVVTILKVHSACGHHKAFSTCASHLTAISIFHSTILFLCCVPSSTNSRHTVKVASVFYTVVIPILNPWSTVWEIRMSRTQSPRLWGSKLISYWAL